VQAPAGNPWRFAGFGIQLAVTIFAGALAGRWLDRRIHTDGIFTMLGALLGFGITLYSLVRELNRAGRK